MLSNATNQPKSTAELGYMCPRKKVCVLIMLIKWSKIEIHINTSYL